MHSRHLAKTSDLSLFCSNHIDQSTSCVPREPSFSSSSPVSANSINLSNFSTNPKLAADKRKQQTMVFTVPSSPALPSYTTPELYSLLAPITTLKGPGALFTNWASTYSSQTTATFRPSTIEQVRLVVQLAKRERKELRASGSGHSPSDLVCTDGFVINMDGLDKLLEVSRRTRCLLIFFFCFRFLGGWVA